MTRIPDVDFKNFYRNKNVLITGGLGFIGSNLAISLVQLGARVTLLDNMAEGYGGNFFNIDPVKDEVAVNLSDIRDQNSVNHLIQGKDVLFHLAGQVCHVMSLEDPFPDIDINIKGTAVIAEACKKYNPEIKIVFTGTRGQYGPSTHLPVSEDAPTNPKGIYEISNLTAEKILKVYNDTHGIKSALLRLTNIYGPRSQMKHSRFGVVNWFVRLAMDGQTLPIFGDGKIMRDFLFIDDCVDALLRCGYVDEAAGEIINVGHDQPGNFLELTETLKELLPETQSEFTPFSAERKAQEPGDFYSDITRIKKICGWSPLVSFKEGLSRTIEFYEKHKTHYW